MLTCRAGEEIVKVLQNVEDCKGTNSDIGEFIVTNLRFMWIFNRNRGTNISVGFDTIRKLSYKARTSENEEYYVLTYEGYRT